jgi:predicted DNA-binding protein (MmcQ/YjbR family)
MPKKPAPKTPTVKKVIERHILSLPGAKLSLQWGNDRVFKVGGKMFAVLSPDGSDDGGYHGIVMSFKVADDSFEVLTKQPGIIPAPYLARAKWVALEKFSALKPNEIKAYVERAHAIVASGLSKKAQKDLGLI